MNSLDPNGPNNIANHIESLKGEILTRWRDEVHRDAEQAAQIHQLDDEELEDHLPALTDKVIKLLRGASTEDLEEDAAQHGRQRARLFGSSAVAGVADFPAGSDRHAVSYCRGRCECRKNRARPQRDNRYHRPEHERLHLAVYSRRRGRTEFCSR